MPPATLTQRNPGRPPPCEPLQAELKHGRICMLAFFGYVAVDAGLYAPGAPHVSSLMAHDVTTKSGHMLALLFAISMIEVRNGGRGTGGCRCSGSW